MRKMMTIFLIISVFFTGCVYVVKPAPPARKVEIMPTKPHPKAVWVPGHWKWKRRARRYIWVPGHWR